MPDNDALDRILSSEEAITPSSGFAARVRGAIDQAASEPAPLPFPWGRFMLGVIAIQASLASGFWLVSGINLSSVVVALTGAWPELGYAAATMLATLAIVYAPHLQMTAHRLLSPGISPWTRPRP